MDKEQIQKEAVSNYIKTTSIFDFIVTKLIGKYFNEI